MYGRALCIEVGNQQGLDDCLSDSKVFTDALWFILMKRIRLLYTLQRTY